MTRIPEIADHLPTLDGFCHPDWEAIRCLFEARLPESAWHDAYQEVARLWLGRLRDRLGGTYRLTETAEFMLLTAAEASQAAKMADFSERARRAILCNLEGAAVDQGYGKHVVLLLDEAGDFFRYIAPFYPDGEHPAAGGVCIHGGYSHIVVHTPDFSRFRRTFTHEMTHVVLGHLPLPAWLNEALAMRMEEVVCQEGSAIDPGVIEPGRSVWDAATVQWFWSGATWTQRELFSQSYDLALILWRILERDLGTPREVLMRFVATADESDAGEAACQAVFGFSLADLVEDHLGPGDWSPRPDGWR